MHTHYPIRVSIGSRPANGSVPQGSKPEAAAPETGASVATVVPNQPAQTPLIDIYEGPEGLILEADLPGVSQEDLTVQLEDNVLSLTAKVSAPATSDARLLHEEYRNGDFARSFILSDEVDRERITADLKHGVLRLTLPKAERVKTRRIEIKSS